MKIGFIGTGRMGEALIAGILRGQITKADQIYAFDTDKSKLSTISKRFLINAVTSAQDVADSSEILILAVKPQMMAQALAKIRFHGLAISIAAGINLEYLGKILPKARIIRTMPNNPALVGEGMTVITAGKSVNSSDLETALKIFGSVGKVIQLDEKHLDAVTGLAGSGPAFVYQFVEAMLEVGEDLGLEEKVASNLALQTVLGAVTTLKETELPPNTLTEQVASPGGTTIEGLAVLEKGQFKKILAKAVKAAAKKSQALSKKFSKVKPS
jgi:pyrroline-5-carboxylate reductase